MASETSKGTNIKRREKQLLIIAIVAPIAIALIIAGVPVIWKGLVTVFKTVIPNVWVLVIYLYIAFIAFLLGRITKK